MKILLTLVTLTAGIVLSLGTPAQANPIPIGSHPFRTSQTRTVSTAGGLIHLTEVRTRHPLHLADSSLTTFTRWSRWHVTVVVVTGL